MDRIKALIREPALLIDLGETLVLMTVAFGLPVTGDQQTYIVAAIVATLGLLKAFLTKPFSVAALTDFGRAALAMMASFGVGLSSDQIALSVTALGLLASIIIRGQVSPAYDPVTPAPAGRRGDLGFTDIYTSLLAMTLFGVLALSLRDLAFVFALSGVMLILLGLSRSRQTNAYYTFGVSFHLRR